MDTTRISIARVLALDVPLTWQDAVAVAQEAAMLSDVHAAMNNQPSLVSPETCYITRTGDLILPVTTPVESPDAVTQLLREMLAGRDAPEALETLAFGHAPRDMSGALQRFPITNRRAEIAKLATRALALQSQPLDAPAPVAAPVPPVAAAVLPVAAMPPAPLMPPVPPVPPVPLPPHVTAATGAPPAARRADPAASPTGVVREPDAASAEPPPHVPFIRPAPFRAADMLPPPAPPPPPAASGVPDAELRRLRHKSRERDQAQRRLTRRVGVVLGQAAQALTWRPASPDPRILGGALIVTAAVVSVVWTGKSARPSGASPAAVAPGAVTAAPPPASPTATPPPAGTPGAPVSAAPAPAGTGRPAMHAAGSTRPPRTPVAPPPVEPEIAAAAPVTTGGTERPVTATPRPGVTVTLPAVDPAPGPLGTPAATATDARAGDPRGTDPRSGEMGAPYGERRTTRGDAVYSAGDDDVTPPVLLRQQLPSPFVEPPAEVPDDWPYLELVIDRAGAVEQVRLRAKQPAPGQTLYRHRMLLAAAKAWQFEPARRHGAPVRYVMRVPLEP